MVDMFSSEGLKNSMDIEVSEIKDLAAMNICNINLSTAG